MRGLLEAPDRCCAIDYSIQNSLLLHAAEFIGFAAGLDNIAVHLSNIPIATKCHRQIKLLAYDVERQRDAIAAERLNAVKESATDKDRTRPQGDSFEHVFSSTDAAIEKDLHAVADGPDN